MDSPLSGEFTLTPEQPSSTPRTAEPTPPTTKPHNHREYPDVKKNGLAVASALCIDPTGIEIAGQDPDEKVHLIVRRHHITNIPWILLIIVLSLLPFFLPFIIPQINFLNASASTITSFLLLYYLFLFGYSLLKFCEWYFHVGLVSNKRLIDIDMHNILSKNVAETEVAAVEDVTYVQKGILQSVFKYGNVHIQTEAVLANFEYDRVPRPAQVAELISDLSIGARAAGGEA